jgi:hypothetical protein
MSQINIRNLSNENDDGSPEIVGVSTFSATSFFVPPKGSTAERPSDCEPGSIRFNTDTANLEYFRGKTIGWSQFELVTPNLGGGTGSNTGLGTRGLSWWMIHLVITWIILIFLQYQQWVMLKILVI